MIPAQQWPPDVDAVRAVQRTLAMPPVVTAARALSFFGEHAIGWVAIGAAGAVIDRPRRRAWLQATGRVLAAHAAAVAVKRIVRRPRPDHPGIQVLTTTYSRLSFPSSHAASTTAAAVAYGRIAGRALAPALVPPMLLSRLVLGAHYPTDVLAGSVLGALIGGGAAGRPGPRGRAAR